MPPRKSVSFKEGSPQTSAMLFLISPINIGCLIIYTSYYCMLVDKKKPSNWLEKQFSRQMSDQSYDLIIDMDYAAAVAAAAYAITTFETTWLESYYVRVLILKRKRCSYIL